MAIGVYAIVNKVNGKRYVGQSVNVESRWISHRKGRSNAHLQAAFHKYGLDNFEFILVKKCKRSQLDREEQRLLDQRPEYNKSYIAGHIEFTEEVRHKMSVKRIARGPVTEETKKKTSDTSKGRIFGFKWEDGYEMAQEVKDKISVARTGMKFTDEHKENISISKIGNNYGAGNKGKVTSDEVKLKLSEAAKRYWQLKKEEQNG